MKNLLFFFLFFKITHLFSQNAPSFYDFGVREVRIYFTEKNWEKRLDSLRKANPSGRILCATTIDGKRFEECGIRYKGNSSYKKTKKQGFRKLPFNIKLDFKRPDQALAGGETVLKLANVTGDPSFIREVLTYEIARNYMPAPRANFVRLYINDSFSGLYTNVENIDDAFLEKNYGYSEGVLIKCDPELDDKTPAEKGCPKLDPTTRKADLTLFSSDTTCFAAIYELDSKFGWGKFRSFLQTLNQAPEKIEDVLNVDQALWMLAINNVLVNLDSYSGLLCHNFYIFQDSFGRFQPILWDLNLSFGGFRRIEPSAMSDAEMQQMPLFLHENNPKRPLISQLLKNPRYKKLYVAHVRTILDDWFLNEKYLARAREMQSAISSWVKIDTIKLYDFAGFESNLTQSVTSIVGKDKENVIGIEELMKPRVEFLKNQPALKSAAPLISQVLWVEKDSFIQISARIEHVGRVAAIYFRDKNSTIFEKISFNDDGQNGDGEPNDHQFFAKLPSAKVHEFYVLAENLEAISMFPAQAPRVLIPVFRSSAR